MMTFEAIATERLRLMPFDDATATAVLDGDLSGVDAAEGWPHPGTLRGLRSALEHGEAPGWMVMRDGKVIGDCGTHGSPNAAGDIEIGYGLAAPWRGRGYGTELVAGMTAWLLAQPGIRVVRASTLSENIASRRVLEHNEFSLTGHDDMGQTIYERR